MITNFDHLPSNNNRKLESAPGRAYRGDMRMFLVAAVLCLFALTACGTKRINSADLSPDADPQPLILKEVIYGDKGLPLFTKTLSKRPVDPGEQFAVVLLRENRPVRTLDVVIKRSHGNLLLPVKVVFNWTIDGLLLGAAAGLCLFVDEGGSWEIIPALGAVGGAVGLVVGLVNSIQPAVEETEKILLRAGETILMYTNYEYNAQSQLIGMSVHDQEKKTLLMKTVFHYENDQTVPISTYSTSYPDHVVPVIDWSGLGADPFLEQDSVRSGGRQEEPHWVHFFDFK